MDTLRLDTAVGLLTRDSKHRVALPDGGAHFITASPLLVQLRMAVANSSAAATFAASSGTPMPIAAGALDLMQEISATVNDNWWATYQLHKGQGRGKVASELRAWAAVARVNADLIATCQRYCEGWVVQITGLLQPVRRWEIKGACPGCKAERVVEVNDDGERIGGPALVLVLAQGGDPWGECRGCGQKFAPEILAKAIAIQSPSA